jgi:hypothetical protein
MATTLNIVGLVLNAVGVILLFFFAMPYRTRSEGKSPITVVIPGSSEKALEQEALFGRVAWVGLAAVVLGTILQIWTALPSIQRGSAENMAIYIQPDWRPVIGVVVTVVLGFGVGPLVRCVQRSIGTPEPPTPALSPQWDKLMKLNTGGAWIGRLEGLIFFASLWVQNWWPILSAWLVFKLAVYWQSSNYAAFPLDPPSVEAANYIVAKRQLGANHVATLLVGTAANIVAALIGVAVANSIKLQ